MSIKALKNNPYQAKRGDTIIEVMFAIAVFCLVAVISVSMMNTGVVQAENALEAAVTRNELNAQAEALRFIHSAYISERTLPTYVNDKLTPKYQVYTDLWNIITDNAIDPNDLGDFANLGELTVQGCEKIYEDGGGNENMLSKHKAFVLNTRDLATRKSNKQVDQGIAYIPSFKINGTSYTTNINKYGTAGNEKPVFSTSPLNARLVFYKPGSTGDSTDSDFLTNLSQNRVLKSEGIWVIAVKGATDSSLTKTEFYDFYIQSCWNGPTGNTPQSIDTVIRLYEPGGAGA